MANAIFLTWICLWVIVIIRLVITHRIRIAQLDINHDRTVEAIHRRENHLKFHESFDNGPSYDAMIFDLTKWTRKQFYGE